MFTGIIEELGKITNIAPLADGKRLEIATHKIMNDVKVDDSVAVNGICLTVTSLRENGFQVEAVGDTLRKSTLNNLRIGDSVNLERALRLSDRLGGHLVQGHVNGVGQITGIRKLGENYDLEIETPVELLRYLILEGSVAVDGISLTIARLTNNRIGISVIPHTWKHTNLSQSQTGRAVNLEVDVIAKYVEKLLSVTNAEQQSENQTFTDQWFKQLGY